MRVLIVGNSVSDRPFPDVPSYAELVARALSGVATVETLIGSGETIGQLEERVLRALSTAPDRLILQVGINECAPRPLALHERARLETLRPEWLRRQIIRVIHRLRPNIIRARALQQFMALPAFVASVKRVLAAAHTSQMPVLILPITTVTAVAEERTPFTNREIARYNAALLQQASPTVRSVTQTDIFGPAEAAALVAAPETVHLGAAAHVAIANLILDWLDVTTMRSEAM